MEHVIVLMSTYNGEKYLRTQIDSILAQEGVNVSLLVRDDGSTDNTVSILEEYQNIGKLHWYSGPNLKPAKSFMDLIQKADEAPYYAFSDQDDYWLPHKLAAAIDKLKSIDKDLPALYYGKPKLVDSELRPIENIQNRCYVCKKLEQAVISSNATGCTMCFNLRLRDLIKEYEPEYQIMHDGWIHKVCLAVGGKVIYDNNAYIYYRQHNNNVIGGRSTFSKRFKRRIKSLSTNRNTRSKGIREIVNGYSHYMDKKNLEICKKVATYNESFDNRVRLLFDNKIRTGDYHIDFMYKIAVICGLF